MLKKWLVEKIAPAAVFGGTAFYVAKDYIFPEVNPGGDFSFLAYGFAAIAFFVMAPLAEKALEVGEVLIVIAYNAFDAAIAAVKDWLPSK